MLNDLPHSEIHSMVQRMKQSDAGYAVQEERSAATASFLPFDELNPESTVNSDLKKKDIAAFIRVTMFSPEFLSVMSTTCLNQLLASTELSISGEEAETLVKKCLSGDEFIAKFIPVFDETFTHEEIRQLTDMYNSDVFTKFIEKSPILFDFVSIIDKAEEVVVEALEPYFLAEQKIVANEAEPVTIVTQANFSQEVLQSEYPVVLDVYATWCGPCRASAPIFSELCEQFSDKIKFAKLDIDKESAIAQEFGVNMVPTFLFIKDGKVVEQHVGGIADKDEFIAELLRAFL